MQLARCFRALAMALGANRAGGRGGRGLVTAGCIGRDTASDGWVRVQVAGMGIASYDVTGDGYPDVFLTSQAPLPARPAGDRWPSRRGPRPRRPGRDPLGVRGAAQRPRPRGSAPDPRRVGRRARGAASRAHRSPRVRGVCPILRGIRGVHRDRGARRRPGAAALARTRPHAHARHGVGRVPGSLGVRRSPRAGRPDHPPPAPDRRQVAALHARVRPRRPRAGGHAAHPTGRRAPGSPGDPARPPRCRERWPAPEPPASQLCQATRSRRSTGSSVTSTMASCGSDVVSGAPGARSSHPITAVAWAAPWRASSRRCDGASRSLVPDLRGRAPQPS